MAVIGIDQSLTGTGVAEIDHDGKLIRRELLKIGKSKSVERLKLICDQIVVFCQQVNGRFVVAREGYSFGSRGRATFSLGELGGCIDLTLFTASLTGMVSYYVIPPTVVKKFCFGSGSVKKDSAYLLSVYNKFRIEFPDDNQADAFMIAKTVLGMLRGREKGDSKYFESLTLPQKEALVSSVLGKKGSGVTKAVLKKIDSDLFANTVAEVLEGYKVF